MLALALWQLKLLAALLFLAFILAAAMRPTVERLAQRGIPRGVGIGLHYVVFIGLVAGFLWLVVPRAIDQVDNALGGIPTTRSDLGEQARQSTGIKHDILVGLQRRLEDLPAGDQLVDPAVEVTLTGVRGRARDLLRARERRLLDLRARPGRGPALLAAPPAEAEARARHVGADRREARRVRPRTGGADRARRRRAVARVLGDRAAVLAPARSVRRARRDRPGDRPARGRGARGRGRPDRLLADRARRRPRRPRRPAARGLPRDPAAARRRGRPDAARRPRLRDGAAGSSSAASPSSSRSRSPP